jgi:hypothetical protein
MKPIYAKKPPSPLFQDTTRVKHEKYGIGVVTATSGFSCVVRFDSDQQKRVVAQIELTSLEVVPNASF